MRCNQCPVFPNKKDLCCGDCVLQRDLYGNYCKYICNHVWRGFVTETFEECKKYWEK